MTEAPAFLLLDIEGTLSPLAFVHEVMFPYAKERLLSHLEDHWNESPVQAALEQMARDAQRSSFAEWHQAAGPEKPAVFAAEEARKLMAGDVKATGLKLLQGLIWEQGFRTGALRSTLFPDVPEALRSWHTAGKPARIYSSGSVHAQKLFFAHTEAGDLTPLLAGYYDTTIGSKKEADSYRKIAADCHTPPEHILFVSDISAELNAAREAGMATRLAVRPGNAPQFSEEHPVLHSLAELSSP